MIANDLKNAFRTLLPFLLILSSNHAEAQQKHPVKWRFEAEDFHDKEVNLTFRASIEDGWHIYSVYQEGEGPMPTEFKFDKMSDFAFLGKIKELSNVTSMFDSIFFFNINYFEGTPSFSQRIRLNRDSTEVRGSVTFMACTMQECLLPETVPFRIPVVAKMKKDGKKEVPSNKRRKRGNTKNNDRNEQAAASPKSLFSDSCFRWKQSRSKDIINRLC